MAVTNGECRCLAVIGSDWQWSAVVTSKRIINTYNGTHRVGTSEELYVT